MWDESEYSFIYQAGHFNAFLQTRKYLFLLANICDVTAGNSYHTPGIIRYRTRFE